ncbi:hypothetical protein ONZ43_g4302 [Nemania bipapillata]|uniref:Uncharacterized protein n=1 Tax=Nemania bipapillata TaxID=110536 RepID=A0ACC2IPF3_9PEZI|nr:hypothetical protein ONZ43_g4302 [Nemania bipapillata]
MADYSKMKVVELKAELKRLGLPQNGLKVELISRLEEAAASEGGPGATPEQLAEAEPEATPPTEPSEAELSGEPELANDAPGTSEVEPRQEPQAELTTTVAQDASGNDPQAQTTSNTTSSETPLPVAEVAQDVQKRKRRSTTPPPVDEVARKRLRQDDSEAVQDVEMEAAHDDECTAKAAELDDSADHVEDTRTRRGGSTAVEINEIHDTRTEDQEDSAMANAGATDHQKESHSDSVVNDALDQETRNSNYEPEPEPEPDIEPSMHPATRALYIKNFMRPLRPQAVRNHLLELATPANTPLDTSVITNFYLDNIRTHAFAVFTSVSAASRVRSALHKRVWPDETNRKALWIDFIPSASVDGWIDIEQQAKDRGNMPRYGIIYERDGDGGIIASLEETDATQAARQGPASPIAHSDRKASIPTGPSRPSGIENAPTGPRNPYPQSGPPPTYLGRQDRLEPGFMRTKAAPAILYRPVSPELAQRRLDCLAQAKDRYYNEESGKDYHRYYFERDDVLVNRGPEIFLGIRPPHREKERRELARASGVDPRDRNYRDRRGPPGPPGAAGGGGGGRRRRRAPRPHGVPRGGDRFRPGSSYDDRSVPDDRRPSHRDGYGGSSRRKESYRH